MIQKTGEKERHKPGYETLDNGDRRGRWEGGTRRSMTRERLRSGRSGVGGRSITKGVGGGKRGSTRK